MKIVADEGNSPLLGHGIRLHAIVVCVLLKYVLPLVDVSSRTNKLLLKMSAVRISIETNTYFKHYIDPFSSRPAIIDLKVNQCFENV